MKLVCMLALSIALSGAAFAQDKEAALRSLSSSSTSADAIRIMGPPDWVILKTDDHDAAKEWREFGDPITKELVWDVPGCHPVQIDFDSAGRYTGANFASLIPSNKVTFCNQDWLELVIPGPEYSCSRPDRTSHCK